MPVATDVLRPVAFGDLAGWHGDDHAAVLEAFQSSARRSLEKPYRLGELTRDHPSSEALARQALEIDPANSRSFFESHFRPHRIEDRGFLTGFFEPEVEASRTETGHYRYPLYAWPDDLVEVDDHERPTTLPANMRYARRTEAGLAPYHDRAAINDGALARRGLEIAWLADPVDVFFIHVQGAARLRMNDGTTVRVTYAAKSGHPYTSVARILCERDGVPPEQMTADRLADWMRANREQLPDLLAHNRSYIFFRLVEGQTEQEGPVAAAKVPLVAGRSLAVDRTLHTFGMPFWIETDEPLPEESEPVRRLMVAHDTGSAIVGPARGDIFTGSGAEAGLRAGRVRHAMTMTVLLPKGASV